MTKPGLIRRQTFIYKSDLDNNPSTYYIFGDNMLGLGFGGQAEQMRGARNAIGIPTKWAPTWKPEDFFCDADLENPLVFHTLYYKMQLIASLLEAGRNVVVPAAGIGTGRADLARRAPKIAAFLDESFKLLFAYHGEKESSNV